MMVTIIEDLEVELYVAGSFFYPVKHESFEEFSTRLVVGAWCRERFGHEALRVIWNGNGFSGTWRWDDECRWFYHRQAYYFRTEEDAALFKLFHA